MKAIGRRRMQLLNDLKEVEDAKKVEMTVYHMNIRRNMLSSTSPWTC
jgi:hypothetical protein